jgi:CHASE2 domain-containing sensor protein/tRNA A-37 threonylcarbamoyl transferase component Bud32
MARTTGADPRLGTRLADYRIVALAGRGGMSVVYRARDERLGRDVALKLLAPELTDDEQFRQRFLRESQVAASLHHPSIVPVYAAGEAEGILYLAMRYVDGADLKALLRRETSLEPPRAVALLGQVAAALDTAHRHGLVHRDVKPANILLEGAPPEEYGYLADFGLTKTDASRAATSTTGHLVGTLDYVAPEQIRGQMLDGRADVYSLACVLYESLAGSPPFTHGSEVALLYAHLQDAPPPASERHPGLPPAIDAVLSRALAKQPEERHASAGELVADASQALAIPAEPLPRRQRWLGRGRIASPVVLPPGRRLTAVVALLAAVGLAVGAEHEGALARPEEKAFDLRASIRGEHDARDVIVVGLDEAGNFPPRRSLDARVIERLSEAGAKVIAYITTQFTEPTSAQEDNALLNAVSRASNVVLATAEVDDQGHTAVFGGDDVVREAQARVGYSELPADADGVIRRMPYSFQGLTSFAVTSASRALGRPISHSKLDGASAWIDFAGPPGKIERLSFRDVLNGTFDARRVRGKVAVVGAAAPELRDIHTTPVGARMSGPEVQANAIQTALDGFPLRDPPGPVGFLAIVVLGILGMLAASRLRWSQALAVSLGVAAIYLVVVQVAFDAGIVLPVTYPLFALAAGTFLVDLTRLRNARL